MPKRVTLDSLLIRQASLRKELEMLTKEIISTTAGLLLRHINNHGQISENKLKKNSSCWAGRLLDKSVINSATEMMLTSGKITARISAEGDLIYCKNL